MENAFLAGLAQIANLSTLLWMSIGSVVGILLGALPGLDRHDGSRLDDADQLPAARSNRNRVATRRVLWSGIRCFHPGDSARNPRKPECDRDG